MIPPLEFYDSHPVIHNLPIPSQKVFEFAPVDQTGQIDLPIVGLVLYDDLRAEFSQRFQYGGLIIDVVVELERLDGLNLFVVRHASEEVFILHREALRLHPVTRLPAMMLGA